MLNRAYQIGRIRALADAGVKTSADLEELGDYATPVVGGINPIAAGLLSGGTDPGSRYLQSGALTGLGSLGGILGGAYLGKGLGSGVGQLLSHAGVDADPRLTALLGAIGMGTLGGALGSHYARSMSKGDQTAGKTNKRPSTKAVKRKT